jgi:fibro-slime domain-containing protein
LGTEVAGNEAVETVETVENEVEETVEEGSVAVEDEESSTAIEDKEDSTYVEAEISEEVAESSEDDSEDDEEEKEEEDDPERLSELEILPGKTAYINFYYTIDPEIEGMKDQKVDFSFAYTLEDEEGKQTKNTLRETFRYAVDALNLMTVTAGGEKGYVETGKEDEMLLEFDLGLMREVLEEAIEEELEKTKNGDASAAEAKRASASELLVGWEDENGERPLGKKDPAVIKNLKCEVETFGVKLDKFKAVPVKDDDNFGTSLKCSFYVSRKTLPGTYYGRVNASYKIKGKSFHTTQGFKVMVKQETGEMELVGKIGDSEIVMTGPVSSFPKADELSLKVSEVTQEQQEKVDEALQKKVEEEGTEINQYKALDIKLMADGVETEPEGDVQVRFKNVNLEKVDENKEAEQEKAEEQSIVKKAVRKVMSLFSARDEEEDVAAVAETGMEGEEESKDSDSVKVEGSEEAAGETGDTAENSENIKVLHLDEDAVVANEMKSEVQDNGDVVMDTDHFSIYIVVNVPDGALEVPVTIRHYATVDQWEMWALKNGKENPITLGLDGNYYYIKLDNAGKPLTNADGSFQIAENQNGEKEIVPKDTKLNVYEKYAPMDGSYTNTFLYPGSRTANQADYNKVVTEIYEPDINVKLPNGAGTGVTFELLLHDWSKVSKGGNYEVEKIKVTNDLYPPNGQEFNETPEGEKTIINLAKDNNEIIIYYKPTPGTVRGDVEFHDYNVTIKGTNHGLDRGEPVEPGKTEFVTVKDGKNVQHKESEFHVGIRSNRVGMNNESLGNSINNRIGVGIASEAGNNSGTWHQYNNLSGNFNNISKSELKNINIDGQLRKIIDFNMSDPGLFDVKNLNDDNELLTEEWYDSTYQEDGGRTGGTLVNNYIAKKYFDDYQLEFNRNGDTYILSSVYRPGNSNPVVDELYRLQYTGLKWKPATSTKPDEPLYSNLFWPMDEISYGIAEKTRDPFFGAKISADSTTGKDKYGFSTNDELRVAENENKAHNWYFGMRYDFEFNIDGYIGPMNYYFRGDDDFWLYVDGTLVQDVNLGGIHSSAGAYVDLRRWMTQNNKSLSGTHTMSVFFMERGGTGSCCYMSFTLPRVTSIPPTRSVLTKVAVEKDWQDEGFEMRPPAILVQLKQDGNDFGDPVLLTEENGWKYVWENLPQNKEVAAEGTHTYTVEEISNPPGYSKDSEIRERTENGVKIFTITNKRLWNIQVEKKWVGDEENLDKRPGEIEVELWKKYEEISENSTEAKSVVPQSLNEETEIDDIEENSNDENSMDEESEISDENVSDGEFSEDESNSSEDSSNSDDESFISPTEGDDWIKVETVTLKGDENGNWKYTWRDMPLYEKDSTDTWKKVIYTIKELDGDWLKPIKSPDGWYEVSYGGDAINGFTITNTLKDSFSGELSITKECIGLDSKETFEFEIEEGEWIENKWTPKQNSSLLGTTITVNSPVVKDGKIIIDYKMSDVSNLDFPIERWYKISEKNGSGNFIYDKTFYVVKMIITRNENGIYTAEWDRDSIYKDGILYESSKDEPLMKLPFVNYKSVNLELEKKVNSTSPNLKEKEFTFTTTIWKNNEIFEKREIKLKADGKAIIPVPVGSRVEIKENEESHAGYSVKFKVGGVETNGATVSIDIPADGFTPTIEVTCTNTPGAVLPDTGGPGLLMMSRLGWMLLLLALLMAGMEIQFYGERRNRKTANVQREDTSGFDPDDY